MNKIAVVLVGDVMRLIVFGEKLEDRLFEIVQMSNALHSNMLFFKHKIAIDIQKDDVLIVASSVISELLGKLENKIITVTFSPKYKKSFSNETVISISEIPSILNLLKQPIKFPVINDKVSKEIFALALKVASCDATVLISGETGTGKEILAKYIHENSSRKNKKFVSINCAAIPETLLESELFGYERGAFSGAVQKRIGKFQEADHGTILLDEISEMPLSLQAKLLRVIQEREVSRLGSNENIKIDVRIIATTNRDLAREVEEGRFREDLYYRLNVITITSPKLNDRIGDIRPLAQYFCEKYSQGTKELSERFIKYLESVCWKGNIRELENAVQRAVVLANSEIVDTTMNLSSENPKTLKEMEREIILNSLQRNDGNKSKTSEELNISIRTLRHKLAEYQKSALL